MWQFGKSHGTKLSSVPSRRRWPNLQSTVCFCWNCIFSAISYEKSFIDPYHCATVSSVCHQDCMVEEIKKYGYIRSKHFIASCLLPPHRSVATCMSIKAKYWISIWNAMQRYCKVLERLTKSTSLRATLVAPICTLVKTLAHPAEWVVVWRAAAL